jgi:hypothetical protein
VLSTLPALSSRRHGPVCRALLFCFERRAERRGYEAEKTSPLDVTVTKMSHVEIDESKNLVKINENEKYWKRNGHSGAGNNI